ncbi:ATP-dependent zinc protease [Celeribacter sp.]|uniref:ATP-dependent zinc protease family protein n=1 Tax=Celeribacter sp. TaxID=1890673 RepID=UPI003A92B085
MTPHLKVKKPKPDLSVVGWMEYIDLPDLGLHKVKAKFDTGARTSALHAMQIETFERDDTHWVRFHVDIEVAAPDHWVEAPVHDTRHIKNTSGVPEERIVILTPVTIAGRTWPIAVSLTDRSNMRSPMIVGRTALKHQNIAVHTRKTKLSSR